ncbi:MAG: bifunctional 4-hydroxy-2-oxoglutarate aldolase/2-dehydro-3-deoxy-phosphogluconate aldolase [Chitinivibrionales bacterium]|nr:bifunctional 4-hydroxy-2-oxoglutarate aldolase/2-dehydro-3-deoxy-phosphogluconate aldolase [Chitinivibrionales bacterium]
MPQFDRLTVYNTMLAEKLVPLFYNSDPDVGINVLSAVHDAGASLLEFTSRGPGALQVFDRLVSHCESNSLSVILGVGSVVDAPTAALFLAHGANFIVSPVFNPEIARLCNRRKVACIPGAGSVSEISAAEELGAEIVKIFPGGPVGGPGFIKTVKAPMPWVRLMPTGGVDSTEENIRQWIDAGAACLGMGSKLIKKEFLESKKYAAISDTVRDVLKWIGTAGK